MRKTLTYILLIFLLTGFVQSKSLAQNVKYDQSDVDVRRPDNEKIEKYKNDNDFNYKEEPAQYPVTVWDIIREYINDFFSRLMSNEGAAPYFRWTVIILLFLYLLVKLFKITPYNLFFKQKERKKAKVRIHNEDINELDLDELINESVNKQNFREAIRYLYLKLLKLLNNHELITWKLNKTNNDYLNEVSGTPYNQDFRHLTFVFEYLWYGNFNITHHRFNSLKQKYIHLFTLIEKKNNKT